VRWRARDIALLGDLRDGALERLQPTTEKVQGIRAGDQREHRHGGLETEGCRGPDLGDRSLEEATELGAAEVAELVDRHRPAAVTQVVPDQLAALGQGGQPVVDRAGPDVGPRLDLSGKQLAPIW